MIRVWAQSRMSVAVEESLVMRVIYLSVGSLSRERIGEMLPRRDRPA
jgi:hypothetical protein